MFLEPINKYYILNNKIIECANLNLLYKYHGNSLYEVIRVINQQLLFVEDHLDRLNNSILLKGFQFTLNYNNITKKLNKLIEINAIKEGNIALQVIFENKKTNILVCFIQHQYPSESDYKKGINATTYMIERSSPQIKQSEVNKKIRQHTQLLLAKPDLYEIILVDHKNIITEGTKSNIFFIKNKEVFTPDSSKILEGITRKHIIYLCNNLNIPIHFIAISRSELTEFEAAFITGTSPKILPVKAIDQVEYFSDNKLLRMLMAKFDGHIESYIQKKCRNNPA